MRPVQPRDVPQEAVQKPLSPILPSTKSIVRRILFEKATPGIRPTQPRDVLQAGKFLFVPDSAFDVQCLCSKHTVRQVGVRPGQNPVKETLCTVLGRLPGARLAGARL